MDHRHITDSGYSSPAIDSIIERGQRKDWALLQIAMRGDLDLCNKVLRIATHNLEHPYTIRYHYWYHYAQKQLQAKNER